LYFNFYDRWLNGEAILSMLLTSISLAGRHSEALPALVTIALAFVLND
jgi:hypothetical protein